MPLARTRTDLPVLLLHNIDQAWDPADIDITLQEVANLESAIEEQGHPVTNVPVINHDLGSCLSAYDPDRHIVFNWCEEVPGLPDSEVKVAHTLEERVPKKELVEAVQIYQDIVRQLCKRASK